jgi:site-specific DNA-methyltransferase (adenine-specific)
MLLRTYNKKGELKMKLQEFKDQLAKDLYGQTKDEAEAKQKLLRLNSQYGQMTVESVLEFTEGLTLDTDELQLPSGLLEFTKETEETVGDDDAPEAQAEAVSQLGEIYELGEHRLMCGDSTDSEQVGRLMGGDKADMVFTDPPYGVEYEGIKNDTRKGLQELLEKVFENYFNNSKSGASIYVFHSDRCADIFHLVFRRFFHFSSMIIWTKNSLTLSQTDYQSQHEPCLYGWMENGKHSWHSDRKQTSIWRFDKERCEGHTTPKPVELVSKAISNSSKSGDIVIDLFGGSGSTLIACAKTERKCRMMELDPIYCDVIRRRWTKWARENGQEVGAGYLEPIENS